MAGGGVMFCRVLKVHCVEKCAVGGGRKAACALFVSPREPSHRLTDAADLTHAVVGVLELAFHNPTRELEWKLNVVLQ